MSPLLLHRCRFYTAFGNLIGHRPPSDHRPPGKNSRRSQIIRRCYPWNFATNHVWNSQLLSATFFVIYASSACTKFGAPVTNVLSTRRWSIAINFMSMNTNRCYVFLVFKTEQPRSPVLFLKARSSRAPIPRKNGGQVN